MRFTPSQIDEMMAIVDKYTLTFVAHHVGPNTLTPSQIRTLQAHGVSTATITANQSNIAHAFKFGLLSDALTDTAAKNMTFPQLKKYLKAGKMFKLSPLEQAALKNLQYQTTSEVTKFSNKVKSQIVDKLVYADKKNNAVKHGKLVTDATKKAIQERKGIQSVISDIGHSLDDWERDFGRIADFVMHTAFDEGRAMNIERKEGADALVYKDVYAGACPHCIKAYLSGGIGSAPKVFKLSEIKSNATNVGRKTKEWKPVLGPHHPWCRCTINKVPEGFTLQDYNDGKWLWVGNQFIINKDKWERKVKRKSKVKVTVNGKTTEI